ncbi:hypothetical protein BCR35DRAFT_352881 [Leucosporidium creatinivorum]|uniref:RRM domain-containing protein n=1 Tax=Leucosporidium creatinivorum TaxID=106004 RepID=A0A1Y2F4U6_9BASI|nr:hypothetical protein BCR35DRAFT_352881 [Leucosporidium creatinivorum]
MRPPGGEKDLHKVFVRGTTGLRDEDLSTTFSPFGEIISIRSHSGGYSFVTYRSTQSAADALEVTRVKDHTVECHLAFLEHPPPARFRHANLPPRPGFWDDHGGRSERRSEGGRNRVVRPIAAVVRALALLAAVALSRRVAEDLPPPIPSSELGARSEDRWREGVGKSSPHKSDDGKLDNGDLHMEGKRDPLPARARFADEKCCLAVRNLSKICTAESLRALASECGQVSSVVVHHYYVGEGMLEYETTAETEEALRTLNGRQLHVRGTGNLSDEIVLATFRRYGQIIGHSRSTVETHLAFLDEYLPVHHPYFEPPPPRIPYGDDEHCRIAVRNLSKSCTSDSLRSFAAERGRVRAVGVHLNFIGEGMLEYTTIADADKALRLLNGRLLHGMKVCLKR